MKIGMVVNNLEVSGGYQKLVLMLSFELRKMGHDVIIYTPVLNTKACYPELIKKENTLSIAFIFAISELAPLDFKRLTTSVLFFSLAIARGVFPSYDLNDMKREKKKRIKSILIV